MFDDFFTRARELEEKGEPFATAVVVRVERPTSGKPGDRAIITAAGEIHGWIGGSCTRPAVLEVAREALRDGESRLIRLSAEPDEGEGREGLTDLAMTCFSGGTMEIYIEPQKPRPRLLIAGHQELARSLAALGRLVGYRVVGVELAGESVEGADEVVAGVEALGDTVTPATWVVVATHGEGDEQVAEAALAAGARYVGLVASRRRAGSIVEYLRRRGFSDRDLEALKSPAGLDLGARRPHEIALSILAEIVQLRRSRDGAREPEERESAVDPVCGMTVDVATAKHVHEYRGERYYFCGGGCLSRFAEEPERVLAS